MYHYYIRCSSLVASVIQLVEFGHGHLPAVFALEKSVVDAVINGLHIGYVASDKEIERRIELARKGRGTGYSGMEKRARDLEKCVQGRRSFMKGRLFEDLVKKNSEWLNEFGHGGLLSTALAAKNLSPDEGLKVVSRSVFLLDAFLSYVFMLEGIDVAPLEAIKEEFDNAKE